MDYSPCDLHSLRLHTQHPLLHKDQVPLAPHRHLPLDQPLHGVSEHHALRVCAVLPRPAARAEPIYHSLPHERHLLLVAFQRSLRLQGCRWLQLNRQGGLQRGQKALKNFHYYNSDLGGFVWFARVFLDRHKLLDEVDLLAEAENANHKQQHSHGFDHPAGRAHLRRVHDHPVQTLPQTQAVSFPLPHRLRRATRALHCHLRRGHWLPPH